jgi:hypothetical protein
LLVLPHLADSNVFGIKFAVYMRARLAPRIEGIGMDGGGGIMANEKAQNWRALCKAISAEQDSARLQALLTELLKSLDESNSVNGPTTLVTRETSITTPILTA